jgi:GNAT superfamily N-acetyltransferase
MHREWTREGYLISTDPARLDLAAIHQYLSEESYWARNIPLPLLEKALAHSRCYGIYGSAPQANPEGSRTGSAPPLAGFGRLVTDYATFAYVGDVFVLSAHRGLGLSKWLVECMLGDPDVQGLRNWTLYTKDAQSLYARYGFRQPDDPATVMTIKKKNPYSAPGNDTPSW